METPDPIFVTLLADSDGICRWKFTLCNYDTGNKPVDLLICLSAEELSVATRPTHEASTTWSPPYYLDRTPVWKM